jgi:HD-GYP domain-containing protein (c-di-GMP phosphodiesterase class II)
MILAKRNGRGNFMISRIIDDQTGLIKPGDHLVILYNSGEEIIDYIINFIRSSLLRNEHCLYIKGDTKDEEIIKKIELINRSINSGHFSVLDSNEAYSIDGVFNPDKMIEKIKNLTEEVLDEGYEGLAITGEISSVLDYENGQDLIIEYEWKLNEFIFNSLPVKALCRYNLGKFSDEMIINIIQLHPYIIYENKIHENPFYIPPEGYKNNNIAKHQVKSWLKNINNFTSEKDRFFDQLAKKEEEMEELHNKLTSGVIKSMLELLSIHDTFTNNHSENVADLATKFATHMGMNDNFITKVYYAGLAHDIGKILVSREILNKEDTLEKFEFEEIKKHPKYAFHALRQVEMIEEIAQAVKSHHERWDGEGYPDGLKGDEIPIMGRLLAIIDSYDAMTSDRPYRKEYCHRLAVEEIFANAGTQFDPYLASEFIKMINK